MRRAVLAGMLALAIAAPSAAAAAAIGAPLPWLLGALVGSAVAAMAGLRIGGVAPALPSWIRPVAIPVIGVAIGGSITPEIIAQAPRWWPSLAAVLPFVIAAQLLGYAILRALSRHDRATAFFAASPGGLVDSILIGERRGGAPAAMATQHFARIALTVAAAPLLVALVAGRAAVTPPPAPEPTPLALLDAGLLLACAFAGAWLGRRFRLPAGALLGPLFLSAGLHLSGLTTADAPRLLVAAAQLVVGAALGLQFAGVGHAQVARGIGLAAACVAATLVLAAALAALLAPVVDVPAPAVFLAFAPGGVAEMGLVAVGLGAEPAYVIAHHLLRIGLTVTCAPLIFDRLIARAGGGEARAPDAGVED